MRALRSIALAACAAAALVASPAAAQDVPLVAPSVVSPDALAHDAGFTLDVAVDTVGLRETGPRWPQRAAAVHAAPDDRVRRLVGEAQPPAGDTARPRPRAVEISDAYARRLTIHRWGSYAMIPLFVAQYALGARLLDQKNDVFAGRRTEPVDDGLRTAHAITAGAVGALFLVNTVTGVWNLAESRGTPGAGLRTAHAATMFVSEAGFIATGVMGRYATDHAPDDARRHRAMALTSMGIATVGASLMWFRRD